MVRDDAERPVFHADNLTIVYEGARNQAMMPLQNFNLKIRRGQITCILGASGGGKTTLLKALGGFLIGANSGGVLYKGRYLTGPTPEIVMIFQENNLFPWLSVRRNVGFGLQFKMEEQTSRKQRVQNMLSMVGLDAAANLYPYQLSGGMRQRTAIARALVTEPAVLLLDEPFGALDVNLRRRMHVLLHEIWQSTKTTMVMVTHSIEEAAIVGHRVLVLGGQPARILIDRDSSAPEMKDRYSASYLAFQRDAEAAIY
jgi:ABC-type nitrate/sulfonate/bicarbonate transport system ATPase subunit